MVIRLQSEHHMEPNAKIQNNFLTRPSTRPGINCLLFSGFHGPRGNFFLLMLCVNYLRRDTNGQEQIQKI